MKAPRILVVALAAALISTPACAQPQWWQNGIQDPIWLPGPQGWQVHSAGRVFGYGPPPDFVAAMIARVLAHPPPIVYAPPPIVYAPRLYLPPPYGAPAPAPNAHYGPPPRPAVHETRDQTRKRLFDEMHAFCARWPDDAACTKHEPPPAEPSEPR